MSRLQSQLRRRIQAQLAAAMLLLAALFAVAWILSIVAGGFVERNTYLDVAPSYKAYTGSSAVVIDSGRVLFTQHHNLFLDNPAPRVTEWTAQRLDKTNSSVRAYDAPHWAQAIGIDWRWETQTIIIGSAPLSANMHRERDLSIPFWLLILITATTGWLLGRRNWIIRRRVINGQCPACGYDIRATPDHCPECGFTGATSAAACPTG